MNLKHFKRFSPLFCVAISLAFVDCATAQIRKVIDNKIVILNQKGGNTIGYSKQSGIKLIKKEGLYFKDLNHNGKLDIYEDWRRPVKERAQNLASQLSIEEIAGLMLYSDHQAIPCNSNWPKGHYNGKMFQESGAKTYDITDEQKKFLKDDYLRHVLITSVSSTKDAARWNNNVQEYVEGLYHGIPANNSSDPRHSATTNGEFNAGNGGSISMWPSSLGLAATFNPSLVKRFGEIAGSEYRALGLATALSPQIDIATEPRWVRFNGTFGESPELTADMARAYCDGFQSSFDEYEIKDGWGYKSVNAMIKHWPGGGACEAGRDAHYSFGKYSVYPGNNFKLHQYAFLQGGMKLDGKTKCASAVMPYYTVSFEQGKPGEEVGNSFSHYMITDLLRDKYKYDGVVCTDWGITKDEDQPGIHAGKCWGVEKLSVAERHYRALIAGVDQFGGNNDMKPILEAYQMGVKQFGEKAFRKRFEQSAVRLLLNIFRVGLFENPYLDPQESDKIVGCPEYMQAGYDAQIKSIVMVKNSNKTLPLAKRKKVYMPKRHLPVTHGFFGSVSKESDEYPIDANVLSKYYDIVDNPNEADFAIMKITNPNTGYGFSRDDLKNGGNGYIPISLQYGDYIAVDAREKSIAGGDPYENFTNRTYKGKSTKAENRCDMDAVISVKKQMGNKPVIVIANLERPMILAEIEPYADAILIGFDVMNQAFLDIISGNNEPSGLLPMQFPKNMTTVEKQYEDTPFDLDCYVDSDSHSYDFGYGLNWKGVIKDNRIIRYRKSID